jgi:ABC-2 type transport system ATP-binding protein
MGVIEVNNLTKDYGHGRGVFNVSFNVNKGEVFGFLGPNGAGKSTTIRHLMGFSKPDSGETKIFNENTFKKYYKILNRVGYIPGEIALPRGLTGWEFIRMMQNLQHIHNEPELKRMLDIFKLDDVALNGDTKKMSLGVKRKLAVVVAFMGDPDVLILDEPTSGLDPVMQERFIELIREEKEKGKTILLSSHIFSEVDATCDRIAIIKDGKIVSQFVANDLKHATTKYYELKFKNDKDFKEFTTKNKKSDIVSIINLDEKNNYAYISTDDKNINKVISLLSSYPLIEFSNRKETLEDYFMKFYKEDKNFGGAL